VAAAALAAAVAATAAAGAATAAAVGIISQPRAPGSSQNPPRQWVPLVPREDDRGDWGRRRLEPGIPFPLVHSLMGKNA